MTDYKPEPEWSLSGYLKPTPWWDYLPFGKTHRIYHAAMMAIALMVLWKVRKL